MTGQMDPVAARAVLAIKKSWVQNLQHLWFYPQILDLRFRGFYIILLKLQLCRQLRQHKACESKKGGAKTVFPTLLFSTHSYHLIDTIRNICCLFKYSVDCFKLFLGRQAWNRPSFQAKVISAWHKQQKTVTRTFIGSKIYIHIWIFNEYLPVSLHILNAQLLSYREDNF